MTEIDKQYEEKCGRIGNKIIMYTTVPQPSNIKNTSNKSCNSVLTTYKDTLLNPAETFIQTKTSGNNKNLPHNPKKVKNTNSIKITKILRKEHNFNNTASDNREMTNRNNRRTRQIITTTPLISSMPNNRLCNFSYSRNTFKVDSIWKTKNTIEKQSDNKISNVNNKLNNKSRKSDKVIKMKHKDLSKTKNDRNRNQMNENRSIVTQELVNSSKSHTWQ